MDFHDELGWLKDATSPMWLHVSRQHRLSEQFIHKYSDRVDWEYVSKYQKLSESFISQHSHKVDWHNIVLFQLLRVEYIRAEPCKSMLDRAALLDSWALREDILLELTSHSV